MDDLEDAEAYFATCLNTSDWDDASEEDKIKALAESARAITRLGLNEPEASFENAITLLSGVDLNIELATQRVKSEKYTDIAVSYDSDIALEHLSNGIVSYKAWLILRPLLRELGAIRLNKV